MKQNERNKKFHIVTLSLFIAIVSAPAHTRAVPPQTRAVPRLVVDEPASSTVLAAIVEDLFEESGQSDHVVSDDNTASPLPHHAHLSSHYGYRRGRTTGARTFHAGTDFHAQRGTPVYAVRPGIVEHVASNSDRRGQFSGYGNAVVIFHPDEDCWTFYAHLEEALVEVGQKVETSEHIGSVGNSSNGRFPGMGVHLHFEVRERTQHGTSPFPGPYRVNNQNPEHWLAEHGIVFDDSGTASLTETETEESHEGCSHAHQANASLSTQTDGKES